MNEERSGNCLDTSRTYPWSFVTDKNKLQKIVFFIPDQGLHIRVFSLPFVFPTYINSYQLRSKPRQHFLIDKSDHRSFWCYETLFVKLLVKYKSVMNILQVILFELQQQHSEMI
jgi:hypothetical protein